MAKTLWIDLETTGIHPVEVTYDKQVVHNLVTEIAVVLYDNGTKLDQFQRYIKYPAYPEGYASSKACKMTGLTPDILEEKGEDPDLVHHKFGEFIKKNCDVPDKYDKLILCGYNVSFDKDWLYHFMRKYDPTLDSYFDALPLTKVFFSPPIDVFSKVGEALNQGLLPVLHSYRLTSVCKYLDVKLGNAHSAMDDIVATKQLYDKLCVLTGTRSGPTQQSLF